MPRDTESGSMDLDQLERYLWWAAGVGWAITFLFVLGEFRGWWNDAGEVGATVGSVLSGLLTVVALLLNATKGQVSAIREGVTDNGRRLGLIHDGVRGMDASVQGVDSSVRALDRSVRGLDESVRDVDEAVRQLHEDNERQTEVLVEIRDRL